MKIPAHIVFKVVSFTLVGIGLILISLSTIVFFSSGNGFILNRGIMLSVGSLLLLISIIGPIRVIYHGAHIPIEIKRIITIQAVVLPLSAVVFLFAGIIDTNIYIALAYFIVGICALYSAVAGFHPLSKTLPNTFYIHEMVSIIKSTGITRNRQNSKVDQAFQRWTTGSEGLAIGDKAYDGRVVNLDGQEVFLTSFFHDKPLVLNLASYSCPHHRKRIGELHVLMEKWKPTGVEFLTVYTAEAHAEDGWKLDGQYVNDAEYTEESDFCFPYAKNIHERQEMAKWLINKKHFAMPVVLDTMEDSLLRAYNSWPIRLYIIHQGKIVYCGDQGPFGYSPPSLDPVLQKLIDKNA